MKTPSKKSKSSATKGERLNWGELSSMKSVKLTKDSVTGIALGKDDLRKRSNSNSNKAIVIVR